MYTDMFKLFSEQAEKNLTPFHQYNRLMAKHVEQMTQLQLNAINSYGELGLAQFKAAGDIHDMPSLMAFNGQQVATLTKLSQQLSEDSHKVQEIARAFKADVDKLAAESLQTGQA